MVPYDVQIFAAMQIAKGRITEMKTGEGKTLTATMPAYLHALAGRGSHVVTVNDYLAARDHELMEPVFRTLGLASGVVTADTEPPERKRSYRKDITYGTAKEFGFDFLRDRLALSTGESPSQLLHRKLNFVLVDEVDSVLIDEARTPLIIGITDPEEQKITDFCFRWAAEHAPQFVEDQDLITNTTKRKSNSNQLAFSGCEPCRKTKGLAECRFASFMITSKTQSKSDVTFSSISIMQSVTAKLRSSTSSPVASQKDANGNAVSTNPSKPKRNLRSHPTSDPAPR